MRISDWSSDVCSSDLQSVFDADLARDQIDEATVDKVRRDAARPLFGEQQAFALDPRQAADARTDRAAGAQPLFLGHVDQPRVLERLARGVDAIDDERVDLALDLVIDALAGVEAIFVIGGLHLPRDRAFLIRPVDARDLSRPARKST